MSLSIQIDPILEALVPRKPNGSACLMPIFISIVLFIAFKDIIQAIVE